MMYPNHSMKGGPFQILVESVVNDCYFTYAPLCFSTMSLSFGICIFAAKFYGLEIIFKEVDDEEITNKEIEQ